MELLTATRRRELRAQAHPLNPVVMISENGLTVGVCAEIERALASHALIKIRVLGADRDQRISMLEAVCSKTGAQAVQHIGRVLIIYREPPEATPPATGRARAKTRPRSRQPKPSRQTARGEAPGRRPPSRSRYGGVKR